MTKTNRKLATRWKNAKKPWTQDELDIISDKLGVIQDRSLARLLGRSPHAIKIVADRRMSLSRSKNFLTSKDIGEMLGVESKAVVFWHSKGWLTGRKSHVGAGVNKRWMFFEEDIEKMLRARPWLCERRSIDHPYYKELIEKEYRKDPWYTPDEAAPLLHLSKENGAQAVYRYLKKNFIKAERKPSGGTWAWIIRRSAIEEFLRKDPRPIVAERMRQVRLGTIRESGYPQKLSVSWLVKCPDCGQDVYVITHPKAYGPEVLRELKKCVNGTCTHGAELILV